MTAAVEVSVSAPEDIDVDEEAVRAEVLKAEVALENQWGLALPGAVQVAILPPSRFRRMAPGDEFIRYDGLAAAGESRVAIDARVPAESGLRFSEVLWHELFHIAVGPLNLPRWFDEGMAMHFTGGTFPVMAGAEPPARRVLPPVSTLDLEFASDSGEVIKEAYAEAFLFVEYLSKVLGDNALKNVLAARKADPAREFGRQFREVTGRDLDALFVEYRRRRATLLRSLWNGLRQVPLFAWLAILLVIGGILKRKRLWALLEREEGQNGF